MRRQAPGFQADDIGDVHRGEGLAAAGQVAGGEDLKIVRGGMAGETQILLALAEDFMGDGRGQADRAETANGQVVAVVDQTSTASATVVSLSVSARGLPAKPWRARLAEGSVKSGPMPWGFMMNRARAQGAGVGKSFQFADS